MLDRRGSGSRRAPVRANSPTYAAGPSREFQYQAAKLERQMHSHCRMNWNRQICILNLSDGIGRVRPPGCPTRERIARGFSRLQDIQLVRTHGQDLSFGKPAEERIIWRELLDLELQEIDEHIERRSASAAGGFDRPCA